MLDQERARLKRKMLAMPTIQKQTMLVETKPILYSNSLKSTSRLLFEIVAMLKECTAPVGFQEILRKSAIDLEASPELLAAVRANPRITSFPDDTFQYQATYHIRTKQDLLELLKAHHGVAALEVKELRESYIKVDDLIDVSRFKAGAVSRKRTLDCAQQGRQPATSVLQRQAAERVA